MTGETGAKSYLLYGWETTFRNGSSTRDKVFGRGQRVTGVNRRENLDMVYELYYREPQTGIYKQTEGTIAVEWILANPWFLKAVMGQTTPSGSGPYAHTFTKTKDLVSMEIEIGHEVGSNVVRKFRGAVFNSVTLTGAVGDTVRTRADIMFFEEATPGTTMGTPAVDSFDPFAFQHATLEIPSGTPIGEVQSFELTITNNALGVFGLGSEKAVQVIPQAFDVRGRMSTTLKNSTFINNLRSSSATLKFIVTNGLSGQNERSITFTGTGVFYPEQSTTYEPNTLVLEDVPVFIRDLEVVAVNNTPTCP